MSRILCLCLALLAGFPAVAATQLTGSYTVIDLPEGFEESQQFSGALWPKARASILITELPPNAFEPVAQGLLADKAALSDQGILLDETEEIRQGDSKALIGRGSQQVGGQPFDKWLLLIGAPHVTLLVTAQIPTVLASPARRAKIETVLKSIAIAEKRSDPRKVLPFTFGETERFRFIRALSGSAALLTDAAYIGDPEHRPLFVIAASLGQDCRLWADGVHQFAENAAASVNQVQDLKISATYDARLGTDGGVVTEAAGQMNGQPVLVVQSIRFRDCSYIRTVGIGPVAEEALYRAEFAMLASKVTWQTAAKPQ
tara:strand:- start:714 stop:1658 length:945 start_codon:yes stop_codon:yes gene_type:complete